MDRSFWRKHVTEARLTSFIPLNSQWLRFEYASDSKDQGSAEINTYIDILNDKQ